MWSKPIRGPIWPSVSSTRWHNQRHRFCSPLRGGQEPGKVARTKGLSPCLSTFGPGVKPEHLNDSRIGRVLDQLYKIGITRVFVQIVLAAIH
ncbi:MAG: DUF4277 domain-containing protein [Nodosilinea sp.]